MADQPLEDEWFVKPSCKSFIVRRHNPDPKYRNCFQTEHVMGSGGRQPKCFRSLDAAQSCADKLNAALPKRQDGAIHD